MFETVIFDFGGVLLLQPTGAEIVAWLGQLGVPLEDPVAKTLLNPSESALFWDLMRGRVSERHFWEETARAWKLPPEIVEAGLSQISAPVNLNRPLVDYLEGLQGKFTLGILSNAGDSTRQAVLNINQFDRIVKDIIISAEEGFVKPEPEIYQIALKRLGARAESTVFVDDLPENIAAAQALGITGVWHQDNATTLRQLDQLLFGEG